VVWLLKRIFTTRNITTPVKAIFKVLFGLSGQKSTEELLAQAWAEQHPLTAKSLLFKIVSLPKVLLQSVVLATAGVIAAVALLMFRSMKAQQLSLLKQKEKAEQDASLEAAWRERQRDSEPILDLVRSATEARK